MKLVVVALIVMQAVAFADTPKLALQPAKASEATALAKTEAECAKEGTPDSIATAKIAVGKVAYTALHDCKGSDQSGAVEIVRGADHFLAYVGVVRYSGANMTAAPERLHMLRDRFSSGSFADRTPAVVYRVDLHDAAVCFKAGCGEESLTIRQVVAACTIPTAASPIPRCTEPAHADCDTEACAAPTFDRGVLTAGAGRGRKRFVVP
jgi:hypothetical protein